MPYNKFYIDIYYYISIQYANILKFISWLFFVYSKHLQNNTTHM